MKLDIPKEIDKKIDDIFKKDKKAFYDFLTKENVDIANEIEFKAAIKKYLELESTKEHKKNINEQIRKLAIASLFVILGNYSGAFNNSSDKQLFEQSILIKTSVSVNISNMANNLSKSSQNMETRIFETLNKKEFKDNDLASRLKETNKEVDNNNLFNGKQEIGEGFSKSYDDINQECEVEYFIWRTQNDSKVRPAHAERRGKRFDYYGNCLDGNISDTRKLLPGEDYNCRCYMEIPKTKIVKYIIRLKGGE